MATATATATTANKANGTNGNGHRANSNRSSNGNGHNRLPGNGATGGKSAAARRLKAERLFTEYEKLKAAAKEVYSKCDQIEAELLATITVGDAVPLSDGRVGTIQDNFLDRHGVPRNVSYKPCGVRRFEISIK